MNAPLRLAGAADVDTVAALMREFYAESGYPLDAARARAAIAALAGDERLGRLWLVEHEGQAVGYLALTFGWSLEYHGRDAFVDDFFVRAAFRGRGLGTRVLAAVEEQARALGVQALHLEVERGNRAGQALYRNRGFHDQDRQLLTRRLTDAADSADG